MVSGSAGHDLGARASRPQASAARAIVYVNQRSFRADELNAGDAPALAIPKDAAAVILLRHQTSPTNPEVFLVRRSEKLSFLGGFHAFPGGQFDPTDASVSVKNCEDAETAMAISCAARELFEETQMLTARGGDALTLGQRASLLDDLQSGRMSWPALLQHYNLQLDANDFTFVGRWVTPPFSARRFDTWFFLVNCPPKQRPTNRSWR